MFRIKRELATIVASIMILTTVPGCRGQVTSSQQQLETQRRVEGSVTAISSMASKRATHTATLLKNGKVLVAGGFIAGGGSLSSAEVFDPATSTFSVAGNMTTARSSHTATLLPSGKVLIVGGYHGNYLKTSEIYDPATNRFTLAREMGSPRSGHVAVTLTDGKILIAGGVGTGWTFLKSAEVYDPATGRFSPTGDMSTERESHTATLLKDGRVLITGGHRDRRESIKIYRSSEIYDPKRGGFAPTGELTIKRHKHEATLLNDGRVLIFGGSDERDGDGAYQNAEVFDAAKGTFAAVANNMVTARYKLQGAVVVLPNGKVLIAGGADRAEVFDPTTNSFLPAEGDMGSPRLFATATLLQNGKVLILGGYRDGRTISDGAWIYSP